MSAEKMPEVEYIVEEHSMSKEGTAQMGVSRYAGPTLVEALRRYLEMHPGAGSADVRVYAARKLTPEEQQLALTYLGTEEQREQARAQAAKRRTHLEAHLESLRATISRERLALDHLRRDQSPSSVIATAEARIRTLSDTLAVGEAELIKLGAG